MEYVTVKDAARKWNISVRLVQQYCADGRIEGAQKFSRAWAIPADAQRPAAARRKAAPVRPGQPGPEAAPPRSAPAGDLTPMPLMNTAFTPGRCLEYVEGIEDPRLRDIARAEYHYFSGHPEEAAREAELYLSHTDLALRLSACLICIYSNLSIGQIQQAQYTLMEVRNTIASADEHMTPQLRASAVFIAATAAVLLHLPLPEGAEALQQHIRFLPPGLRMFALYVQAHYTYLLGDHSKSAGIVEAAFAMQTEVFPIPAIYMHMVAVMDYMSLKQPERAPAHLLASWELAQPDDLIEPFGEHHGLLGGMLEAVLKKDWPEDFKRIIAITYRFSAGWRKIHNPVTGDHIADNLTTTEFATAMLAVRGWTNQEIAAHLGVSPNTVKQHISSTLLKLGIKQRKDLKRYMLR